MYTVCGQSPQEVRKMATVQSNENWKKENTIQMTLRLMKKTEGDIINILENSGMSKRARLLQLVRLGIEYEKLQREGTAPTNVVETVRPKLKNDYGFERTASGLPDLRKVKRWNQKENNEEEKEK